MDFAPLVPWLSAAALLISIGVSITTFLTAGAKQNARTLANHESRILQMEGELKHLPDSKDVTDLKLAITEMRGSMNTQAEVMSSVARTVQRLEGYLLERGK